MNTALSRRQALMSALGVGITVEFVGGRAFAASQGAEAKKKLVVIVCRGGLDGLTLSPPVGDPNYAALRGKIAVAGFGQPNGALKLDDTFGLHPSMTATHALAIKGQARIIPAVATPDRERSHFEAQDVLESGAAVVYGTNSGWLNRALGAMGPAGSVKAISVGPTAPLILRGPVEAASWSPGGLGETDHRLPGILMDLYKTDALLGPALASGVATESMAKTATASVAMGGAGEPPTPVTVANYQRQGLPAARKLGATLAAFMTQPDGKQIAAVSMDGFDSHANQTALLTTRLAYVDAFIDGLATGMGPAWSDTVVVVATEFGRTARVNGTAGTDHGTASTALLIGGALKRGGIVGDWPTLAQNRLFENRDTAPTLDMRGVFKGVLRDHLGVDRAKLDSAVFPNSGAVAPVHGMVA
jgi:uncharacterized protein (DUF1501 family)